MGPKTACYGIVYKQYAVTSNEIKPRMIEKEQRQLKEQQSLANTVSV